MKENFFGSRAVSTMVWSISKNVQFSPGCAAQVSVPAPSPITATRIGPPLACGRIAFDRPPDAAVLVIVGDRLRPAGLPAYRRRSRIFSAPWIVVPCISTWIPWPCGSLDDLVHAKEAAHGFDPAFVRRIDADQHHGERHHGRHLPAAGLQPDRQQHRSRRGDGGQRHTVILQPGVQRAGAVGGTIRATASTAISGQVQRVQRGQRSSSGGRHSAASTSRIGYSATQENVNGATRPANSPPTMPPNDSAT